VASIQHGPASGHVPRRSPRPGESSDPARYRREAERLRPLVDAQNILGESEVAVYLGILGAIHHTAINGVRSENHPGVPGRGHPAAQALLRAEVREIVRRGKIMLAKLDGIVGESASESDPFRGSGVTVDQVLELAREAGCTKLQAWTLVEVIRGKSDAEIGDAWRQAACLGEGAACRHAADRGALRHRDAEPARRRP
jgi:hypothetical protein